MCQTSANPVIALTSSIILPYPPRCSVCDLTRLPAKAICLPAAGLRFDNRSVLTNTSRRSITLPPITAQALQEHRVAQVQERLKLGLGRDPRGPIFTRADGEPLDPESLSKAFGRQATLPRLEAEIRSEGAKLIAWKAASNGRSR